MRHHAAVVRHSQWKGGPRRATDNRFDQCFGFSRQKGKWGACCTNCAIAKVDNQTAGKALGSLCQGLGMRRSRSQLQARRCSGRHQNASQILTRAVRPLAPLAPRLFSSLRHSTYRATPAQLKPALRLHARLSNPFSDLLWEPGNPCLDDSHIVCLFLVSSARIENSAGSFPDINISTAVFI